MGTYYDNADLIRLADKVKDLYNNSEIVNYVHNGKKIPPKYSRLFERSLVCSNIQGEKSLYVVLSNAIKYSFAQTIQLNNSTELRMYRETSERCKLVLASYMRKRELGDTSIISEIEKKEEEIKLIQVKIDEIATQSALKPVINKNILTTAEEAYNVLLRTDKTPYYFYLEICKKLGKRVNLDQLFTGFRDKDVKPKFNNNNNNNNNYNNNNNNNYKTYKKEDKGNDSDDNDDYRNFMEMNVKKSSYVPPAFRKNNDQDIKLSRLENILKKEKEEIKIIKEKEKTPEELFPVLKPEVIVVNNTVKPQGAWGKKLVIESIEQPKKEEEVKQVINEVIKEVEVVKEEVISNTSQPISQPMSSNNNWRESAWENMDDY
jgi:hypothetical protein